MTTPNQEQHQNPNHNPGPHPDTPDQRKGNPEQQEQPYRRDQHVPDKGEPGRDQTDNDR